MEPSADTTAEAAPDQAAAPAADAGAPAPAAPVQQATPVVDVQAPATLGVFNQNAPSTPPSSDAAPLVEPPTPVATISHTDGTPRWATNIVGTVVTSRSSMIRGLVSAM